jgi:selenoprotein W-related protein
MTDQPRIVIAYCPRCRWLLRSAWLAQELLSSFEDDLAEVALAPSGNGIFEITAGDGTVLWSRAVEGRFPEAKELKQRVRDTFWPDRDLGHSDRPRG